METGAVGALVIGILMLTLPGWLTWHLVRRWRRLTTWPRAEATIWRLRKVKQDTTVAGTSTSATTVHADYSFQDTAGIKRTGEVDFLSKPQKGDVLEVMYDPRTPPSTRPSRAVRS